MTEGWAWEDTPQARQAVAGRLASPRSAAPATQVRRFQEVVKIAIT